MKSRERIIAALNGWDMDRIPMCEIGVWPETEERWRKEGLPDGISVDDYFEFDKIEFFSYDPSLMLPPRTFDETDNQIVITDGDGCKYRKWKGKQSHPLFLESSVSSIDDWVKLRSNLVPDISRFEDYKLDCIFATPLKILPKDKYTKAKEEDEFTVIVPTEPCWYYLRLLGEEEALCNIALNPDFAEQIFSDYTEFTISMIKTVLSAGYKFDALWVFSDLCYKNGMLFSPEFFKERLAPYQKRIFDVAKENGMKVIYHCDGNVHDLIPLLLQIGIDCIQPLEVRAGNDVSSYLKLYKDKLSFIGNINADALTAGKAIIYDEITSKIQNAKPSKRYVFHSDHSIPDSVSFAEYKYAIEIAKQLVHY